MFRRFRWGSPAGKKNAARLGSTRRCNDGRNRLNRRRRSLYGDSPSLSSRITPSTFPEGRRLIDRGERGGGCIRPTTARPNRREALCPDDPPYRPGGGAEVRRVYPRPPEYPADPCLRIHRARSWPTIVTARSVHGKSRMKAITFPYTLFMVPSTWTFLQFARAEEAADRDPLPGVNGGIGLCQHGS